MSNQEIEQALNEIDHPDNKLLQPIAWWVNSAIGLLSDIAALIMSVIVTIHFNDKPTVISNWILFIAGSYILIYEVFDLAVIKQAIQRKLSRFIIDIVVGFIIIAPVIIFMRPFVDYGAPLFCKLFFVILNYIYQIGLWLLELDAIKHENQHGLYFYFLSYLLQIKWLYLKCKFKNNKLVRLVSPIFYKKEKI